MEKGGYAVQAQGLYQCVAAVPSVYDVLIPSGLEEFAWWVDLIELPSTFGIQMIVPANCLGTYLSRLWMVSIWPIAFLFVSAAGLIVQEFVRRTREKDSALVNPGSAMEPVRAGLQRVLPLMLVTSFLLVPSTSTMIFKTFLCDPIEINQFANDTDRYRSYLHDDLSLSCDSDEYFRTKGVALAFSFVWPVGVPIMYAVLLWASRKALLAGVQTKLSQATAFLSGDYEPFAFWWEPVEMCRKLTLTGEARAVSTCA
jgi:hypothetical protein